MRIILAAGALWALCAQASAQNFQGFHVAAGAAAGRSHIANQPASKDDVHASAQIDDIAPTIRLGYDHRFGDVVVGASWWTALGALEDGSDSEPGGEIELQGFEARAGYALGDWLPFAGVGVIARTGTLRYPCPTIAKCSEPLVHADLDDSATSYRVGVERRLGSSAYVAASYLWADFDPEPIGFGAAAEGDVQAAMIELGWRF